MDTARAPRLSSLRLSPVREHDIVEESQHLEERWRELVAGGTHEDNAARLALAEFRDLLANTWRRRSKRGRRRRPASERRPDTFCAISGRTRGTRRAG
jgi:hypothetical protein